MAYIAALRAKVEALEQEVLIARNLADMGSGLVDGYKSKLAAMTQERDDLKAQVFKQYDKEEALTWERDEAERREKEWELDYSRDLKAVIKERDDLNNVLRHAGWGQGEIDSAAYTFDKLATANTGLVNERNRLKEALRFYCDPQTYGISGGSVDRIIQDAGKQAKAALRGETGGA